MQVKPEVLSFLQAKARVGPGKPVGRSHLAQLWEEERVWT